MKKINLQYLVEQLNALQDAEDNPNMNSTTWNFVYNTDGTDEWISLADQMIPIGFELSDFETEQEYIDAILTDITNWIDALLCCKYAVIEKLNSITE